MGLFDHLFGNGSKPASGTSDQGGRGTEVVKNSGVSYGEKMPSEENQYSFPGTHTEYFEKIFREDFPQYWFDREDLRGGRSVIYRFYTGGLWVLTIELMTERSAAAATRNKCQMLNMPYLRFYYDHHGWWNTRSYVTGRMKKALGLG